MRQRVGEQERVVWMPAAAAGLHNLDLEHCSTVSVRFSQLEVGMQLERQTEGDDGVQVRRVATALRARPVVEVRRNERLPRTASR